jgi:ubiquitin-conjugating enzyme E2 W
MGAKAVRVAYLLLATLLLAQGVFAKQAFSPHPTLSTSTGRTSPIGRSPSSIIQRQNVVDESFDGEECNRVAYIGKRRCLDVRGGAFRQKSFANAALSIRGGGGSSEPNTVQTIVKSILSSAALPEPVKNFIAMICQLLESITGFHILPPVEQKSKAKKSKPKQKEVLVEEVYVGSAMKKRTKKKKLTESSDDIVEASSSASEDEKVVETTSVKRKKKTKAASSDSEVVKNDKETPAAAVEEEVAPQQPKPTVTTTKPKQPAKTDAASKKFLSNNLKSSNPNYRIQRELKEFLKSPPPGLSVKISGKNVRLWVITLSMPDNSIYAGEKYKLRVQFPNDYPTSPPSVYFLPPTPRHEHVYTNGDICLSLLGKDWRPIMTAQSIAQAIFSILCGAQRKSLPMDNARHAGNKPGQKQDDWVYHDDNC